MTETGIAGCLMFYLLLEPADRNQFKSHPSINLYGQHARIYCSCIKSSPDVLPSWPWWLQSWVGCRSFWCLGAGSAEYTMSPKMAEMSVWPPYHQSQVSAGGPSICLPAWIHPRQKPKFARPFHGPYRISDLTPTNASACPVNRPDEAPVFISLDCVQRCPKEIHDQSWLGPVQRKPKIRKKE